MKQSQAKVLLQKPTCNRLNEMLGATNEVEVPRLNKQTFEVKKNVVYTTLNSYKGILVDERSKKQLDVKYVLRKSLIDDTYLLVFMVNNRKFTKQSEYYGNLFQYISNATAIHETIYKVILGIEQSVKC